MATDNLLDGLTKHDLRIVRDVIHLAWMLQEELHQPNDVVAGRLGDLVESLIENRRREFFLLLPEGDDHLPLQGVEIGKHKLGRVNAA